jgi:hypothetical protein
MKRNNKLFCLLLSILLLLPLISCGQDEPTVTPPDVTTEAEEMFPTEFLESEYANNPQVKKAAKAGDKTIRVAFTQPVRMVKGGISKVVYTPASGEAAKAEDFRMYGYSKDKDGVTYATVFEFDFKIPVSGGSISFAGEKGEGHDAIMGVLTAFGGVGLYGGKDGCKVDLSEGEVALPTDAEVRVVRAVWVDKNKGQIRLIFNAPVRCLERWEGCVFLSDVSSPNPGVGGSWQHPVRESKAIDPVKGKDGKQYATTWQFVVSASPNTWKSLPEKGVLRISENDKKASEEVGSATDNFDCGRMVVAIDGRPLMADDIHGWDVAYAWYE